MSDDRSPPVVLGEATSSARTTAVELVLASLVVLFQELALIRWLPGEVRVLAYFPNLVLIAAFLGLGLGSLRARRRSLAWLWPVSLATLALAAVAGSRVAFTQESASEHLWLLYYDLPAEAPVVSGVRLPIVVAFVLTALTFVPWGQYVGERLHRFARASHALWGYMFDLSGSLLGVVGFAVVSFLGTPPVVWMAVFVAPAGVLLARTDRHWWLHLGVPAMVLAVVVASRGADHYSPYYALSVRPWAQGGGAADILANGSLHQVALGMKREGPYLSPTHEDIVSAYHRPYQELGRPPRQALVLGAGTGNDVAVLVDRGAEGIDAVEIDPVILALGREHHPDRPYDSPRVRAVATDARSFLNYTDRRYDLIVFGTLDSMTRTSALSNVRLDNFVYTVESLRAAREHLTEDGGLMLYFMVGEPYIHLHIVAALAEVFGSLPAVRFEPPLLFNRVYLAGPAFSHLAPLPPEGEQRARELVRLQAEAPTDDWPYLYLRERGVSGFYLSLMAILAALAAAGVGLASPAMRQSLGRGRGADPEMFLYGLAFLLLETRYVTAMSLAWGATWLTSAVVFGAILATLLLATLLTEWRPLPWGVATVGLLGALLVSWAVPLEALVHPEWAVRLIRSVLYVGLPIFFAGVCFALRFRARERVELAFGWNLLGAVLGGLLEFFSMALGMRALLLVAAAAYLGAFLVKIRTARPARGVAGSPAPRCGAS